ncbi:type 2 lanthipeptide synthetase LanM family protein [Cronbergia sp. UHCC 0137]|uniref:type 2 lanthipeptide synthetase LanM family protein n=1 Tax=Cronbergia sp. UHCC 0137 TaxID=3110239 RepID=UPI002B20A6EE|nr:type 2 lanthipeptide synthetase LanM family protein [Cronbergia sp. UHCC 0137]MEA5617255.1 type 2 lanthipeptide synthetase LanM family protein [Cronbergia sp. UHCC 0137]
MKQLNWQNSAWYRGMSLTERMALMSETPEYDLDLGLRRLQRWREQSPFTDDALFTQRLTTDGITESELCILLGQTVTGIPLNWAKEIEQAFDQLGDEDMTSLLSNDSLSQYPQLGFLKAIAPLIDQGMIRLRADIRAIYHLEAPFDLGNIDKILLAGLPEQLLLMLNSTLVLELNVARLQGLLKGDNAEERFFNFIQRLQSSEMRRKLWQEYPVLARQVMAEINRWVKTSKEFLQRLCNDWQVLCSQFNPSTNPGQLVKIHRGVGDRHNGGRSVLILKFTSGWQIVYKPRSLAVEGHFQELLLWLNQKGAYPAFKTLQVINRGDYGWVEFVSPQECKSPDEVERFYQRQGGYLSLLSTLSATDFHFENLIAVGEHPILIDLESLFHPRSDELTATAADRLDREMMANSVLRVGLLPQLVWGNTESAGIDLSGLGGAAGQLTPERVPKLAQIGTDTMQVVRQQVVLAGSHNRPQLNDKEVNVQEYTKAITEGYSGVYLILLQHRRELVDILARFAEDEVRVVMRPSRTYALLLRESYHPDVLRDGLERDRLFDKLWVDVQNRPILSQIIHSESQALWQGDIPLFTTYPHTRDLWSQNTDLHLPNFFAQSGMELVHQRLQHLSIEDLQRQQWFIKAALATLEMGNNTDIHKVQLKPPSSKIFITPPTSNIQTQLLETAHIIAQRLELLAHNNGTSVNWMGLTLTTHHQWTLAPMGTDLYAGVPGVTLFLAYLGAVTKNSTYTHLAQTALTTLKQQIIRDSASIKFIGGFSGWGGIIYTLTHLGKLWHRPDLIADAVALIAKIPPLIDQDEQLDIIAGAAGCIASLLSLYQVFPADVILDVATQCGQHLLKKAKIINPGLGWMSLSGGQQPLTGFAHGAAGFASVLWELAAVTGKEEFSLAAIGAIYYERSRFSPSVGNWLDLRLSETQNACMTAWCHGAPGIGLGRLRVLKYWNESTIQTEIATAIQTTINQGFGDNQCLCHGDLGNIDLLLVASEILHQPDISAYTSTIATKILDDIHQDSFRCGVPLGMETPGLMTGLAGIGYGCLRLAYPDLVPSILLLEPPRP